MKHNHLSTIRNCCMLLLLTVLFTTAKAQTISNQPFTDTHSAIEDRLVELAYQNPDVQKIAHQTKISEYQLKAAQTVWLNLLAFNVNLNEFTLEKNTPATYIYPKYNIGLTIPLGTVFSRTAVKSARESIAIGQDNTESIKRTIKEQVLSAYKQYVAYGELIDIQSQLVNDVKTQLLQSEQKFRNGSISLEAYNTAQKNNNAELATLINLRLQQDLKKLEIERIIGVKLETVLNK